MSKSQTVSPSQPSSSLPATPPKQPTPLQKAAFERIKSLPPIDCYRLGASILPQLGVLEPSVFRKMEPDQLGELFRSQVHEGEKWLKIGDDLERFVQDHNLMAVAFLRIAAVGLVGR